MINIKESKSHVIFGSLLIIFGIGVFIFPYIYNQYQEKQEELKDKAKDKANDLKDKF